MEKKDAIVKRRNTETPTQRHTAPRKPRKRDLLLISLDERIEELERQQARIFSELGDLFATGEIDGIDLDAIDGTDADQLALFPPCVGLPD